MKRRIIAAFAVVLVGLAVGAPGAAVADTRYEAKPYITASEQYTSNVFLTNTNAKSDWITTLGPGVRVSANQATFGADLDVNAGYNWYANRTKDDYWSVSGTANLRYNPDPRLTLSLREYALRSAQTAEPVYQQGQAGYVPGTYQGTAPYWRNVISPDIDWKFSKQGTIGLGYTNNILRYDNSSQYGDSTENLINTRFTWSFDQRNGLALDYSYMIGDFQSSPDLAGQSAHARFTHRPDAQMSVFLDYSFLSRVYDSPGTSYTVNTPTAGIEYSFTKSLVGLAQLGYYWQNPNGGQGQNGFNGTLSLTQKEKITTYTLSMNVGYREDLFSSQNLGFSQYFGATAVVNHMLSQRFSVGLVGTAQHADYVYNPRIDWTYTADATASYLLLKWLSVNGRVGWQQQDSNISVNSYNEYHAYVSLTATYQ